MYEWGNRPYGIQWRQRRFNKGGEPCKKTSGKFSRGFKEGKINDWGASDERMKRGTFKADLKVDRNTN